LLEHIQIFSLHWSC